MKKDANRDQDQRPAPQQPAGEQEDAADADQGSSEAILKALSMFLGNTNQQRSGRATPPSPEAIAAARAFASLQAGLAFAPPAAAAQPAVRDPQDEHIER
jgi:hypothetical protein